MRTFSKIIDGNDLTNEAILDSLLPILKGSFKAVKIKTDKDNNQRFVARVKTKLFNPIVTLKGPIKIEIKSEKSRITIDADSHTNGWFWFTFLIGCIFFPLWFMMMFMYSSQKKKAFEELEMCLTKLDTELGAF